MFIERLSLRSFRNLEEVALELDPSPILLEGANAQGKTNLLEALSLCVTGRSFRGAKPCELIGHGRESGKLAARFVRQEVRHDIEVALSPKHRTIKVDGRHLRQTIKLLELFNLVSFFPDDLRMVKGIPEERRRFIDRAIANHNPDFARAAVSYASALRSRNMLLRTSHTLDEQLLESYDEQLITHGRVLHTCREETLRELLPLAAQSFAKIAGGRGALTATFAPGLMLAGDFSESFRAELSVRRHKDRARGMTTAGPHRADLVISIDDKDTRAFASQGQQRAVVLAMKLAELEYLSARLGAPPILLLDDVSSELDTERTRDFLATALSFGSQVWVTTTGAAPLPFDRKVQRFVIEAGRVRRAYP